jgi:large subunit ribosomal protein L10
MVVNIKDLPSKQFQEIKKSIRGHAFVQVVKKNILLRALKKIGKESILPLEKHIGADCAIILSDLEGYELARILSTKKTPVFAKTGQIAPNDIEIQEGPTELVPGPAISELGALGLEVAVENGKIAIKKSKVVITEGQKINENAASIFQKLNIQPFDVGLNAIVLYDLETEKIYVKPEIDSKKYASELSINAGKALGFAQNIIYYCKETVSYFLAKANIENQNLSKNVKEEVAEEKVEVKEEETNKQEEKSETPESETPESEESKPTEPVENTKSEMENKPVEEVKEEKSEEAGKVEEGEKSETKTQLNEQPEENA